MRPHAAATTALVLAVAVGLAIADPVGAQGQPRPGGIVKAAMIGEPPTLDVILAEGRLYIQQAYWLVLSPGIAIMLTIFGLNLSAAAVNRESFHGSR
jgi:hypothetical protein